MIAIKGWVLAPLVAAVEIGYGVLCVRLMRGAGNLPAIPGPDMLRIQRVDFIGLAATLLFGAFAAFVFPAVILCVVPAAAGTWFLAPLAPGGTVRKVSFLVAWTVLVPAAVMTAQGYFLVYFSAPFTGTAGVLAMLAYR